MSDKSQYILEQLKSLADPQAVSGMQRYGINPANTYGIRIPVLREIARASGKDHQLAQDLWSSGIHEARILASMIDRPQDVTEEQMESWVKDFDSWDVCDQVCGNLFDRTPIAYQKAVEWSERQTEFVKRAAFSLIAYLAVHDKHAPDERFLPFFPLIQRAADDERNYVQKAVNWALRQIGKRSRFLNQEAVRCALEIQQIDSRSARWIASDALRELQSEKIQQRLG
jgi:3-methyladenine DNA glycosylase AlkD